MKSRSRYLWLASSALMASPATAACTMSRIAELPVMMEGMRPIVPATINGTEIKFLADSGAFFSLMPPSVAAQLGLKLEATPLGFNMKGIGGSAPTAKTKVKSFGIAGSIIPNVDFLVGGSDTGHGGLLGQNLLGIADAEYDLAGGVIRLIRPQGCEKTNLAYWAGDKGVSTIDLVDTGTHNQHIIGFVMVNGIRMRAAFDTGAPTSMLTLKAAARAGVTPNDPDARPVGITRGLGRNVSRSWIAPFKSFAVGDEQIANARLRFADVSGGDFDMLIGADFFLSHRIFVANSIHRMFLTYNGGPVFDLSGTGKQAADAEASPAGIPSTDPVRNMIQPRDADGFARRGAAYAARRDFEHAMPDLTRAIELAPNEPRYFYTRASAWRANRQAILSRLDLDAAIRLKPDYVEALMDRAVLHLAIDARAPAMADLDAAARAASSTGNIRIALAEIYSRADAYDLAIAQYSLWLSAHSRQDSRFPQAINGRCWARAMLGQALDKALEDCTIAVRAAPDAAGFLDSRGLVYLRMGDLDRAIADYDAALKMQPKIAWSLYGRGLAKQRKGLKSEGDADIVAGLAIDPTIARQAERYGVTAPPK
jgi:tetratricopeptide (TPR) repeat protein/predicted aspartyl protease